MTLGTLASPTAHKSSRTWPTAIDLFCGCGGVTEALRQRHFKVVAAVDFDPVAAATYRQNHPTVKLFERDIRSMRRGAFDAVLEDRKLDLLVVCSPCQPFSTQNSAYRIDDRARLMLSSIKFADHLRPPVILFENVPGMTRARFRPVIQELRRKLRSLGYYITDPISVNAADYAVPQRRVRCLMIATIGQSPGQLPPALTPSDSRITVRDAIADLPALSAGESCSKDALHAARKHSSLTIRRLKRIPKDGGSRRSLPKSLQLGCHTDHRGHPDVYGRLAWDDVSITLTTGCTDVTKGRFAHPEQNRAITPREAARLQTFPDSYKWEGSLKQIAVQVGNAVPPKLIYSIAPMLRHMIKGSRP